MHHGIILVMQSIFMASNRVSCTAEPCRSTMMLPNSLSSLGGSKSLGKMELFQLYASGMKHILQEFKDRSDKCVVECCQQCKSLKIVCICTEHPQYFEYILSTSTVSSIDYRNEIDTFLQPKNFHDSKFKLWYRNSSFLRYVKTRT
jgi:hypothetical protein